MTIAPPHLVLIAPHYPPSTAAGARRPANLVGAFRADGWRVSVICCGETDQPWHPGEAGEQVRVVPIPTRYRRATTPRAGALGGAARPTGRRQRALQRQLVAIRAFPDLWRDAESPLAAAALEAVGDGRDTILYSTAPPITAHQAAHRIVMARPELPWVAEYRDPWTEPGSQRTRWAGTVMFPAAWLLMRRLIRAARLHVVVTDGIGQWLAQRGAGRLLTSLNGIPDHQLDRPASGIDAGTLRYVGEFYLGRDPEPLFASLGRLLAAGALPPECRLELIGDVQSALGRPTATLLADHGLDRIASLSDRLPHAAALDRINRAGLLILLAQGQPAQIPNKLFEYLGARRPILAVVDHDGETHRLLRAAGADRLVITEWSTEADWDRIVAAAVGESTTDSAGHPRQAGLDALRASSQLAKAVAGCRRLLAGEQV